MIHLDVKIQADTPEQLADAFAFLLGNGVDLSVVGPVPNQPTTDAQAVAPTEGNVVALDSHRRLEQGRRNA